LTNRRSFPHDESGSALLLLTRRKSLGTNELEKLNHHASFDATSPETVAAARHDASDAAVHQTVADERIEMEELTSRN
jgi:hypothetical protein